MATRQVSTTENAATPAQSNGVAGTLTTPQAASSASGSLQSSGALTGATGNVQSGSLQSAAQDTQPLATAGSLSSTGPTTALQGSGELRSAVELYRQAGATQIIEDGRLPGDANAQRGGDEKRVSSTALSSQ